MSKRPLYLGFFLIAAISVLTALPLGHEAYAGDDSESTSDSNNDRADVGDKDNDKEVDKDDDSNKEDADKDDDDEKHPHPTHHLADMPTPSSSRAAPEKTVDENPTPVLSGSWWHPHPGTKWQIQYIGSIDTNAKVEAYDLDLFDTDPATIQTLHAKNIKVICYFSAGSYEGWRPDVKRFPPAILGRALEGWKYERWLDIRRIDVIKPIMEDRIKMAKQKGCDAIDPDNVEGYDNKSGFALTPGDQIRYNKMIADLTHENDMAVGLKNDLDQIDSLLPYFDFQVNEQCFEYHTCKDVLPFIRANKPVFNVEYNVATDKFCPQANEMNFDSLKKDLDLGLKVKSCR